MKLKILTAVVALVASVSACNGGGSEGSEDGKAIYCDSIPSDDRSREHSMGIEFRDGKAVQHVVLVPETKAIHSARAWSINPWYRATPSVITWPDLHGDWELDRETLQLSLKLSEKGRVTMPKRAITEYQCEAATSLDDFQKMWASRVVQEQKEIDEKMKDNKI
jgi:hypothetical protein